MRVPSVPACVPRRGSPFLRSFGRLLLRATGWRVVGQLPAEPRFVLAVAPHTSNWDFPLGVAAMFALDLRIHWLGKDTLFHGPLGPFLRWIDGRPVKRHIPEGVVADVAAAIRAEPRFLLALAPEGTRRRVKSWRTGFYRIAEAAGVPIVPVALDWGRHEVRIFTPMRPTGDLESDVAALQALYAPSMARHPQGFWDTTTGGTA